MADSIQSMQNPRRWVATAQLTALTVLLWVGLALVITTQLLPSRYQFQENDVVTFNIKSPRKVTYTSQIETKAERDRAAAAVPEVTEFDVAAAAQQTRKLEEALQQISTIRKGTTSQAQKEIEIGQLQGLTLSKASQTVALRADEIRWLGIGAESKRVLGQVMGEPFTEAQTRDVLKRLPGSIDQRYSPEERTLIAELASSMVRPTLLVDHEATAAAREAARAAVQPVRVTVEKGEIILRDGDVVKKLDIEKLEQVGLSTPSVNWTDILGNGLLAGLMALTLAMYLRVLHPTTWYNPRRLMLVYAVLLIALLAAKLTIPGRDLWAYIFPVAAVPMLLASLLDATVGIGAIAVFAPLIGIVAGGSLELTAASLVGGVVGILGVWRMERQTTAVFAGLTVGATTFLTVMAFKLALQDIETGQMLTIAFLCLVNGVASAVITLGTSSMLGHIFGVTTTPGLLELAHPSHPLFRRLLTHAPGTYHHSVVVANLAERAAQQIGADSLLVRVAAYYHDIGKVARPYCFVENQIEGQNIHDKLHPQMSAKLVGAHVKDGLQMAKQHGLPSKVRDIIEQHHGTKLAMYFYHQACKGGCDGQVTEDDFRYPGPRPQTKEAALIMLADAVEAAVRSADDHSSEGIVRIVNKIVNDTVLEGQLNESDLSLRDIQKTKEAFTSVLQGIFHPRIKYPETEDANGSEAREPRPATSVEPAAEQPPARVGELALEHGERGSRPRD